MFMYIFFIWLHRLQVIQYLNERFIKKYKQTKLHMYIFLFGIRNGGNYTYTRL